MVFDPQCLVADRLAGPLSAHWCRGRGDIGDHFRLIRSIAIGRQQLPPALSDFRLHVMRLWLGSATSATGLSTRWQFFV